MIERLFRVSERGSTVPRELRGGLVTFMAMAYIIVLNPLILGSVTPGDPSAKTDALGGILPVAQVAAVTALVARVMTILFGVVANYPFAIATGLGINTLLAVTIAPMMTWPEAMGLVVIDGIIIVILAVTGFRTAVFNAVPAELKSAIAVGIGAFIALIGLVDSGFVRRLPDAANTTVPVSLGIDGSIASWPTFVFVLGLLIVGVLVARGVQAGILIGIVISTVIANVGKALVVEGAGAVAGGAGSASSNTLFVESASGIAEGARTGLANVLTGVLFLLAMFFTPLYSIVPVEAAAPALVVVGALMFRQVTSLKLDELQIAVPVFLTVVVMPFTYSIANGIGAGFISYVVLSAATGRARQVHPIMWVVAVLFVGYFGVGPLRELIG